MKALAVTPKTANSVRLVDLEKPSISDIADGHGVLVEVLRIGACGTDREINNGEYGTAPRAMISWYWVMKTLAGSSRSGKM